MAKHHVPSRFLALIFGASINVFIGANSIVPFFSDSSCQDSTFTGNISQQEVNGTCQPLPREVDSVDPGHLDSCCAGLLESSYSRYKNMTLTSSNSHRVYRTLLHRQCDNCTKWNLHKLQKLVHWLVQRRLSMWSSC